MTLQRAAAHLHRGDQAEAIIGLQRLVDEEPYMAQSASVYPFALITLARAGAATGDTSGAKQAYEQLLDLWERADPDLPLLAEAKNELATLP